MAPATSLVPSGGNERTFGIQQEIEFILSRYEANPQPAKNSNKIQQAPAWISRLTLVFAVVATSPAQALIPRVGGDVLISPPLISSSEVVTSPDDVTIVSSKSKFNVRLKAKHGWPGIQHSRSDRVAGKVASGSHEVGLGHATKTAVP